MVDVSSTKLTKIKLLTTISKYLTRLVSFVRLRSYIIGDTLS